VRLRPGRWWGGVVGPEGGKVVSRRGLGCDTRATATAAAAAPLSS